MKLLLNLWIPLFLLVPLVHVVPLGSSASLGLSHFCGLLCGPLVLHGFFPDIHLLKNLMEACETSVCKTFRSFVILCSVAEWKCGPLVTRLSDCCFLLGPAWLELSPPRSEASDWSIQIQLNRLNAGSDFSQPG